MIKFLKENKGAEAVLVSVFFSIILSGVLIEINENNMFQGNNVAKWVITTPIFFMAAYVFITFERVIDSYRRAIIKQNQEIDHLKNLLFEKENK